MKRPAYYFGRLFGRRYRMRWWRKHNHHYLWGVYYFLSDTTFPETTPSLEKQNKQPK